MIIYDYSNFKPELPTIWAFMLKRQVIFNNDNEIRITFSLKDTFFLLYRYNKYWATIVVGDGLIL